MLKRLIAKGNIHRSDHLRALVTDTIPGDIPIIFSNDGFYRNWRRLADANSDNRELLNAMTQTARPYTMPYRYNIFRTGGSTRRLSLIHPSSQLDVAQFYREQGHLICLYCRRSDATIRAPHKVGSTFFVRGFNSERNSLKSSGIDTVAIENTVVPLEALNIILVLGEVGKGEKLSKQLIRTASANIEALEYFEIVSLLFCMGNDDDFDDLRNALIERSFAIIDRSLGVRIDSQAAHLALDLLCCPHLPTARKADLLALVRKDLELPTLSIAQSAAALKAFEQEPWFVNWTQTDLLRMIRKEELSAVY